MAKAEAGQAGGTPAPTQGLWPCQWPLRPPSPRTRRQETRTGLQCALAHDRGEGAQALRRARRQPERILRVGLEVLHHKGRGWVEGAAHLRMGGGSGWRDAGRGGGAVEGRRAGGGAVVMQGDRVHEKWGAERESEGHAGQRRGGQSGQERWRGRGE